MLIEQLADAAGLAKYAAGVHARDLADEIRIDRERYEVTAGDEIHRRSAAVGLLLRRALEEGKGWREIAAAWTLREQGQHLFAGARIDLTAL